MVQFNREYQKQKAIYKYILELAGDKAEQFTNENESKLYDWLEAVTENKGCINNLDTDTIKEGINLKEYWQELNFPIPFNKKFVYTAKNNWSKFPTVDTMEIMDKMFDYYEQEFKKEEYQTEFNNVTGNFIVNGKEINC